LGWRIQHINATLGELKLRLCVESAYEKALKVFKVHGKQEYISYIFINKGILFTKQKQYEKAIRNFEIADSIPVVENKNKGKEILYGFLANTYKQKGDYKNAINYFEKQNAYKQLLNEDQNNKALKEIEVNYKTKEKETENKMLKSQLFQNKILLFSIITLLVLSIVIGLLSVKNISKKKKISEQQKLLQVQDLENKLKDNELIEIDKMLEVQDKERRKIADELHDNLGSLLTTLKINFQSLKNNHTKNNELIYEKTNTIIDDAYNEVRNISHLKNLGVIAKDGLLDSVKKMAYLMTTPKKIVFNVIPFGLKQRLENTTEILLYRIIQELCTNILKHANANEVNIYLNQHSPNQFNIMIEDNGKGFDVKNIQIQSGIGLKNIEKKVEQLNGTFTIDSVISKGTTIIIDLPL
jgi:signal transduction histidine kinase